MIGGGDETITELEKWRRKGCPTLALASLIRAQINPSRRSTTSLLRPLLHPARHLKLVESIVFPALILCRSRAVIFLHWFGRTMLNVAIATLIFFIYLMVIIEPPGF